jgi:hypothetical protein
MMIPAAGRSPVGKSPAAKVMIPRRTTRKWRPGRRVAKAKSKRATMTTGYKEGVLRTSRFKAPLSKPRLLRIGGGRVKIQQR